MAIVIATSCASAPTETTRISAVTANSPTTTTTTNADTDSAALASSAGVECVVLDSLSLLVTVIDELGNDVTMTSIDRIIPLGGTVAAVVFALGVCDNVVATDLSATYSPEADALREIGYQRSLTAESITAFAPSVMLATHIAGPEETIEVLRRLGLTLVIVPNEATAQGPAAKIRAVASALGVAERCEQLALALVETLVGSTKPASPDAP